LAASFSISSPPLFSDPPASPGELSGTGYSRLAAEFVHPPFLHGTRPLWFWNGSLTGEKTREIMKRCRDVGYSGFGILPARHMTPEFMTPAFLERYREAVTGAAELGMKMCLYDEYWFPSGSAGGLLEKRYPGALSKRIDLMSVEVAGPGNREVAVPPGKLLGVVAMNSHTGRRIDLTQRIEGGKIHWQVPPGSWKILLFTCVRDGARGLVDYLDPEAVKKFISLTYQKYHETFPEHFGKTIDRAFYDEPTFHWVEGGRAWTEAFNEKFQRKHGYNPIPFYPALWFDIGPDTAAARNALFGFRAELYSRGFVKTINDWCRAHGIELTGHQDQEEIVNPVGLCGDLIKCFRYQDIPAVDQIFSYGRGSKMYKVVSSAAYNYDRPLVLTECYGGIKDMPVENLYREAMDQFAKGINVMVPHAVWYDPGKIIFPPELSYRDPTFGPALPAYNRYMARLHRMLQSGRHVADIGVLYPIATLQAGYRFGIGKPYQGGVIPEEADYMDLGELLALHVRRDYTFIHPEVLDGRCTVAGKTIRLRNRVNFEEYLVFIIPGSKVIHWSNLQKIKSFQDGGGAVIATTRLPFQSAEFGKDDEVRRTIQEMFGLDPREEMASVPAGGYTRKTNARGGTAFFAPRPTAAILREMLREACAVPDVEFEKNPTLRGGNLSYIHKVVESRHIYFFGNSSGDGVDVPVRLRGRLSPEIWDPHTGEIRACPYSHGTMEGQEITRIELKLPPVRSLFIVSRDRTPDFHIRLDTIRSGFDKKTCWVHARAGVVPGSSPAVVLTMQKLLLTGSDVFYALNEMRTDDLGRTWSGPRAHDATLGRREEAGGVVVAVCDFTPKWHAGTGKLLGIGQTVRYRNNRVMAVRSRETAYAVYDPEARLWTPWETLKMPPQEKFKNAGAGSVQRYDLPDGNILIPIYFKKPEGRQYSVTVLRCSFDGRKLRYLEHGSEHTVPVERGLCEPSLTRFRGRYFLTLRNDRAGYVTRGEDGLQYAEPKKWRFDDGRELGNYNTQQHWVTHGDGLFLVYTRRGAKNDHVFRHRAPLFIARVDPEKLHIIRRTERVLVPERGARLGNFGVTRVNERETWVTVTEWMQTRGPNPHDYTIPMKYGADNAVFAARILWDSPDRSASGQ